MSEFSERLNGLLFERNLNGKKFASEIDIRESSVSEYLQGKHLPTVEHLVRIADYFYVSADFLLGREEENDKLKFKPCPAFSERLEFLLDYFKLPSYAIYNKTEISKSAYYDWKSGKRVPTVENVVRLADRLDCRVDFILGREI